MSGARGAPRSEPSAPAGESIAIVGIGCRYADARGPSEFWEICRSGRNTVRDAPRHRVELGYDLDHFYDPRPRIPGKISSKKGGFLEHPELFDPAPFGIAPRDALTMEPQQRLMVEVTWDALDDAGIVAESLAGERVAVILGYMAEDYSRERSGVLGEEAVFRGHDVFTVGGMSHAVLSGRISYLLGVTGPSFTIDTACSSSLIATHLACQSLRRGESKLALAGGVNLFLSPEGNIALSRSGMLSMSGACRAFDAGADGFVRAEGAGVVLLRPLADALAEGNPIYAVIRGSGISTDGRDGGHMMAPGRHGQAQAMRDAYAEAGLSPSDIDYVETHGTGTMIGDPVEIAALAEVMGPGRPAERPLRVASVKGNLGHAESASGVAGLIKAALAIRHRELPAQLHFEQPNPAIPWDEIPIRVQNETTAWPHAGPALVGVNSFGISGTNAHVVLESPPDPAPRRPVATSVRPTLLALSGHDPKALHEMVKSHRAALPVTGDDAEQESALADLAHTLGCRRSHRTHRLAVVGRDAEELGRELDAHLEGRSSASVRTGSVSRDADAKIVMVFPGQGGQWLGMGRGLLAHEPVFASAIDRLDTAYRRHVDWSLRAVLEGRAGIDPSGRLDVLQPLLVALEIALAELWQSFGIRPHRVVGQSMGEIAAASVAGALEPGDVARLACERGRIVARAAGRGAMAVVALAREAVEDAIATTPGRVEVAGSNAPTTTIVSGDRAAVASLVESLERRGVFARRLDVDFASHCFHMDPLLEPFEERIRGLAPTASRIPLDSTVDGLEKKGDELDADYWIRNLRAPVAFDRGVESALAAGGEIFLEVSPHPTIGRAVSEIAAAEGRSVVVVPSLQRDQDEQRSLLVSLAELFVRGVTVDFAALQPEGRVTSTPLYAYQRKRFWFSERTRLHRFRPVHPLLGRRSQSSLDPRIHSWDFLLDADTPGLVQAPRDDGRVVVPAAIHVELALAACEALWPEREVSIRDLDLLRPVDPGREGRLEVQVVMRVDAPGCGELRISSRDPRREAWSLHATARVGSEAERPARGLPAPLSREGNGVLPSEPHLAALERCGVAPGPRGRALRELESEPPGHDGSEVHVARMLLPRQVEAEWHAFRAHPAIVEGAFQLIGGLLDPVSGVQPISVGEISLADGLGSDCWCRVALREEGAAACDAARIVEADIGFFDRDGRPLGEMKHVRARPLPEVERSPRGLQGDLHAIQWRAAPLPDRERAAEVERWIVVSDSAEEATMLAAELQKQGATCLFCEKVEDLEPLVSRLRGGGSEPWGLVLLAWADAAAELGSESARRAFRVASWAHEIRGHALGAREVWIATRGLQAVRPGESLSAGVAARIGREVDTFATCIEMQQCRFFDASGRLADGEREGLARLMGRAGEERRLAGRGETLYVPRLAPASEEAPGRATRGARSRRAAAERNFRALHAASEGSACLVWEEQGEPVPAPGHVVVEVQSAGLGQLDVLAGLGLARGRARRDPVPGADFAGRIAAVGDPDSPWSVGDPVIGVHGGSLSRRIEVPAAFVARKPAGFDFHEAAGLPFPLLVARYALEVVARLRAGERVLVLSAGGAVGQAAIHVARSIGAEAHATAGSPERREDLRSLGALVPEAADAYLRPETDADPERPVAPGDGFDVILGALSGTALHAVLERLAPGGRYLDLCPREHFERPELGALRLGSNRSISAIDVAAMMRSEPTLVAALLEDIARDAEAGRLPVMPTTPFPAAEAGRAIRFMAQNRHRGRVVVDLAEPEGLSIRGSSEPGRALAGEGGCVVSGDFPALRSVIAARLRDRGAEPVLDVGPGEARAALETLGAGPSGCAAWIEIGSATEPHADATPEASPDELAARAARVGFRALVSVRPPETGQAAHDRAWEWRLWVDRLRLADGSARSGVLSVAEDADPERVAEILGRALEGMESHSEHVLLEAEEIARRRLATPPPLLAELAADAGAARRAPLPRAELLALAPPQRIRAMRELVVGSIAGVLGLSEQDREALDVSSRLDELGLDSLMTLEVFVGLGRDLELEIAADWFEPGPRLSDIADVLLERLEGADGSTPS